MGLLTKPMGSRSPLSSSSPRPSEPLAAGERETGARIASARDAVRESLASTSNDQTALVPGSHVHLPALDGIRGLAVLMVMAFHFMLIEGNSPVVRLIQKTCGFGWAGVDLFFVLSGFLITGI